MPAKPVFISYPHGDEPTVVRLKKALKVNGISVWIDHENLEPGTPDWGNGIEYGLRQCQALIYVASPEAKNSRFIIHELEIANRWNIPIVPFWVAGAEWLDVAP